MEIPDGCSQRNHSPFAAHRWATGVICIKAQAQPAPCFASKMKLKTLGALIGAGLLSSANPLAISHAAEGGKAVYGQHCAACHGVNGAGDGPAAVWLYPKPRHFNSGLFKIKSTPRRFSANG